MKSSKKEEVLRKKVKGLIKSLNKYKKREQQQQQQQQQTKEYVASIIDTIREPLIVLDANLRIAFANRSFYKTFKVSKKETENKLIYNIDNKQWNIPKLRILLEKILPKKNIFENFEVKHNFPTIGQKTILLNAMWLRRKPGKENLILLRIEDITKRKEAEEQIKESEERYRIQFQVTQDAIFIADAKTGKIIDCNDEACRLVERTKQEIIGKHQTILHPKSELQDGFSRTFRQHLKEAKGKVLETKVITKTGKIKDVAVKANTFQMRSKLLIIGIFRDIRERKKAEEELKERAEDFERFNRMAVGRELKMIELKKKIKELEAKLKR